MTPGAFFAWLTTATPWWPTVTWGEALFSPLVLLAFGLGVWMVGNLWYDLGRVTGGALRAIREADLRREAIDTLIDGGFAVTAVALLINHPQRAAVFSLAMLSYALLRAVNRILERRYRFGRERYYADERLRLRVLAEAAAKAEAVAAARLAEQAATAERLEAGLAENTALTRRAVDSSEKAAAKSEAAEEAANHVHDRFDALAEGLRATQTNATEHAEALAEDTNERMRQVVPKIVTPQERAAAAPPGPPLTVGEQIERTHTLAEQALGTAQEAQDAAEGERDERRREGEP